MAAIINAIHTSHSLLDSATEYAIAWALANMPTTAKQDRQKHHHQRRNQITKYTRVKRLLSLTTVIALSAETTTPMRTNYLHMDTNSKIVGVDNRASRCISNKREDFRGTLRPVNLVIQGYGGPMRRQAHVGTLTWEWLDDTGIAHEFNIRDSIFDPAGHSLMSPQHWAQKSSTPDATCITEATQIRLTWKGGGTHAPSRSQKDPTSATFTWHPGTSGSHHSYHALTMTKRTP